MLRETFSGIQVLAFIKMLLCFDFMFVFLFCCFASKVNSYVMAGRSVHLTTLFPGQA